MYSMNQLTIIGFTGNDAEAHYTQNGTIVVTISVVTKESWKDADGNWQSRTDWHRIISFGEAGDFTRTLTKGSYVIVQGAVRTREYERDGAKHRIVEVRSDTIGKLYRAERRAETEGEPDAARRCLNDISGPVIWRPDPICLCWHSALLIQRVRPPYLVSTSILPVSVCSRIL